MKLDINCIRDVLLYIESTKHIVTNELGEIENLGIWLSDISEALPQYTQEAIYYSLARLNDGGYISLSEHWANDSLNMCCVNYITYSGHEFLETIRPETVWKKSSEIAAKIGSFSLHFLSTIAGDILSECARNAVLRY